MNKTRMTDEEFEEAVKWLIKDINSYYEENELGDLTGLAKYLINLGYYA